MKRTITKIKTCVFVLIGVVTSLISNAQTLSTTGTFLNNNGSGGVTFNLQNSNSYPIIISEIKGVIGTTGTSPVSMYYNPTPVSGAPAAITTANGWNLVASGSVSATANITTTVTQTLLSGFSFIVPANTTYGILVYALGQRYFSLSAGTTTVTASGVSLITGTNIGYGGTGIPPVAPTIALRGWIGEIIFNPAIACSGTPTVGISTSNVGYACGGQPILLSLANDSIRIGLNYQWLRSTTDSTGPYSIMPIDTTRSTLDTQTVTTWYRCRVGCGTNYDSSAFVKVTTSSSPLAGTYTVNRLLPQSSTNYQSLSYLATELSCVGVSGAVTINVASGSGPYNETVSFGNIAGTSATNTITLNGNGNTIQNSATPIISFLGTQYLTIDSFNITATGTALSGFGIYIGNQAQNITINRNKINVGTIATGASNAAIVISGSASAATTVGNNAQNIIITNNEIIGGYYSITAIGNASYLNNSRHMIQNNIIRDFYLYGVYIVNGDSILVANNDINRLTRTGLSTFYGVYLGTSRNIKVLNNKIHDAGTGTYTAYPVYVTTSVNSTGYETEFINNAIYNINTTGTIYGMYLLGTRDRINIYHNTIALATTGAGANRNIFMSTAPDNHKLYNNIFSIGGSGTGIKFNIYVTTASTSFSSNYNDFSMTATAGTNYVGYWAANTTTLADWKTTTLKDTNSLSADPVFVNLSTGNITPLSSNIDNVGTPVGVLNDISGNIRSTATPDLGALEFTSLSSDIAINNISIAKSSVCYNSADTIKIVINNLIGATIDFSVNPLTIIWSQSGPISKTDSIVLVSDTLGAGLSKTYYATNFNMSTPGFYNARAYIRPSTTNGIITNDTLNLAVPFEVKPILSVLPKTRTVTSSLDTVLLEAFSPIFPGGGVFFSEIAHYKVTTGAPSAGWPSYLTADDYVEITGFPNSSIAGFTMEEWTGTTLQHTVTFPTGTVFSPNGTMILATGQLGSSTPSPTNFYYHTGNTVTHSSTGDNRGYILKNQSGTIIDATVYGTYAFPIASGVTVSDWSGNTPAVSSSGNRLNAADNNTSSCWVNSGTTPQNPNAINSGVSTPVSGSMAGFNWNYLGTSIDTNARTVVGPYTVPGIRAYVASYTNSCGTFYDTAYITASSTVPVKMTSFEGTKKDNHAILNWVTVSEINNDYFIVERSFDGINFEKIGKVKGKNNSIVVSNYSYTDQNIFSDLKNQIVYYRLNQIDFDGTSSKSKMVLITSNNENNGITIFPNPSNGTFNISFESKNNSAAKLKIIDVFGKTVWQNERTLLNGINAINVNLNKGNYILIVEENSKLTTKKIVVN
ncbi:MAG: T9SS type A sorting domain-containing protein [Bacteroidia bacterium]